MEDKPVNEKLIEGLQALYTKLTGQPLSLTDAVEETKDTVSGPHKLHEFFLERQKEWKEKRMKANSYNKFLKIPRVVLLKHLLPYFEVHEICRLCEVCVAFNSLIKSTIFLHYYVSLHEKTGLAINLGEPSALKKYKHTVDERSAREDAEAQLEILQKTREFLSARLKESREAVKELRKDLHELRGVLEAEKGTKEKALAKAGHIENEISEYKRKSHSTVIILEDHIADLEREIREKEREVTKLHKQAKRLTQLETKYRDENKKLEETLADLEEKNVRKTAALQTLCDYFFNSTYPKLEGVLNNKGETKEDQNASRNEDLSIIRSLEVKPKK